MKPNGIAFREIRRSPKHPPAAVFEVHHREFCINAVSLRRRIKNLKAQDIDTTVEECALFDLERETKMSEIPLTFTGHSRDLDALIRNQEVKQCQTAPTANTQ